MLWNVQRKSAVSPSNQTTLERRNSPKPKYPTCPVKLSRRSTESHGAVAWTPHCPATISASSPMKLAAKAMAGLSVLALAHNESAITLIE